MSRFAVIAIGYNRVESMNRLLLSLSRGDYTEEVDLIISIDYSGSDDVQHCAELFEWHFGNKIIRIFHERQGLKKHILSCGDYLEEYDAVALFEDDIVVSPSFFSFMQQSYDFYKNENQIAGISLYSHAWNVNKEETFYPEPSEYDTYFFQFAQSWGQIWLKKQWIGFKQWLKNNNGKVETAPDIPSNVSQWPDNSWLKYHIKYCIRENKYFVYPYISMSSCFSDVGEHQKRKNTIFQVPISTSRREKWNFAPFHESAIKYDAFFERQGLGKIIGIPDNDLLIDLYGSKTDSTYQRFILTMKSYPYHILESYGLQLRPHEVNVEVRNPGNDIFLYDRTIPAPPPDVGNLQLKQFCYHQRILFQNKKMAMLLIENLNYKINRLVKSVHSS